MFNALKKILGFRGKECNEAPLFSGSAYFSNRVPKAFSDKWANGGEISSGLTFDVRARYFFAIDTSEPWVKKLFSKSVTVIHAGWIVHCVDEAFRVPIAEYILDERFVPEPPYKLINHFPLKFYALLSEPGESPGTDSTRGSGPPPVQASDTPSTPTALPRKRKREQSYIESPSGSLVSSGFGKDGLPRRPRKQRKLRFDPSFSPGGGRSGQGVQPAAPSWPRDHDDDDAFSEEHAQERRPSALCSGITTVRLPDTPDKPCADAGLSALYGRLPPDEHIQKPTQVSSPNVFIDKQAKAPPVRTVDFTNLPPARRLHFTWGENTKSRDAGTILSIVKSAEPKIKTPRKITFSDRAQVCVYAVSPSRQDIQDHIDVVPSHQRIKDGPAVDNDTLASSNEVAGPDDMAAELIQDLAPRSKTKSSDETARLPDENQPENDTLVLTTEEVQMMRRPLLELASKNDIGGGQLATLFELGKTYRGMAFRHVW